MSSELSVGKIPITVAHAALLAEMDGQCFSHQLSWSKKLFHSTLLGGAWGELLILERVPVGFYLCRHSEDEGEILTFSVLPAYRGKGWGKKLIEALLEKALSYGIAEMFLEVEENNHSARKLYEKAGFNYIGRRPNYYGRNRDAMVMLASLVK